MTDLWMPGAARQPQSGGVTLNTDLPARATWHITWDAVTNGVQPPPENVAAYLKRMGYCPHLMWDPFTGDVTQFYPANVGGRALNLWNEDGAVNIQIETYFSPGVVHNGRAYQTVAETPCVGLDKILAWLDTFGIPRVWPMGAPQWSGNSRDVDIWNTRAGHYGHCNVPGNTHTDPGPMPSLGRKPVVKPVKKEESEMPSYTRLYPKPVTRELGKDAEWFLKDDSGKFNANYAVNGFGFYDIELFIQGTGLPTGETVTIQFYILPTGGRRSGYFQQEVHGSADGTFRGSARFKMPIDKPSKIEASVVSSASGAKLDLYGAEIATWSK